MPSRDLKVTLLGVDKTAAAFSSAAGGAGKMVAAIAAASAAAAVAVGAFVVKGVVDAAALDGKLREINTLFGVTGSAGEKNFRQIQSVVKDVSTEVGIAQSTIADGLYQAISAGVPKENALTFMTVASKAAIAGVTDVNTAVDGITTSINAFGLKASDAQRVSDSMFTAVKGGKCVVGSTRVLLADGRYERIDQLQAGAEVVAYDGRAFQPMPASWVDQGVKQTVKVRTRLGREITTTWNHPYLTKDGWRKVSELTVGDGIAVPTALPYFGSAHVDHDEAALLGLWLAEGSCRSSSPVVTSTTYGPEIAKWAAYYGCSVSNKERRPGAAPTWCITSGSRGSVPGSNAFQNRLRGLGLTECTSATKHVPDEVFTWDRESVATFLRWMLNGDGWLSKKEPGRSGFQAGFGSKSERLVRDVAHLLLRFGIVGTIRFRGNHWVWSTARYAEVERLVRFVGIDRPAAAEVPTHAPAKQKAMRGLVEFDPIVEISEVAREQVYDLMVPDLHNFVADDIVAHNTTFAELSAALFNVAPAAAASNVSLEEVNAAIATLTAGGTPTSVATTQIRAALTGLQRPSKDLDAIFQKLGFTNAQTALESKGLGFALGAVKDASGGNNGELMKLLGSTEAVSAANVLAGTGAQKFAAEMKAQAGAAGATDMAFQQMEKSVGRQWERLKVQVQNFGIEIGQKLLPLVSAVVSGMQSRLSAFTGWWDTNGARVSAVAVTIGTAIKAGFDRAKVAVQGFASDTALPALTAAIAALAAWWSSNGQTVIDVAQRLGQALSVAFQGAQAAISAMVAVAAPVIVALATHWQAAGQTIGVVLALLSPVLVVLAAQMVALGVAAVASAVQQGAAWVATQVKAVASAAAQVIASYRVVGGWVMAGVAASVSAAQQAAAWVVAGAGAAASAARQVAAWVATGVAATASAVRTAAAWVVSAAGAAVAVAVHVAAAASVVAGWVLMGAQALLQAARIAAAWLIAIGPIGLVIAAVVALGVLIYTHMDQIKAWIAGAWEWVKVRTVAVWTAIKALFSSALAAIGAAVASYFNTYRAVIGAVLGAIRAVVSSVWNAIRGVITSVLGAIRGAVSSYFNAYRSVVSSVMNAIRSVVSSVMNGVRSVFSGALSSIRSVVSGGMNAVVGAFRSAMSNARAAVSTGIGAIVGLARGIGGRVLGAVSGFGSLLYGAGASLMRGLASGISSMIDRVTAPVKKAAALIKGLLPGSPIKYGPLKSWNNGGAGKRLMGLLAGGIDSGAPMVQRAMRDAVDAGDLAGMQLGGAGYVGARLAQSAASAPTELSPDVGRASTERLVDLLVEQNELLRQMPRDYRMGARAGSPRG